MVILQSTVTGVLLEQLHWALSTSDKGRRLGDYAMPTFYDAHYNTLF